MKRTAIAAIAAAIVFPAASYAGTSTVFQVECDHPDAIYRLGETAKFTVTASGEDGAAPSGTVRVRLDNFGDRIFSQQTVDLSQSPVFTVTGQMDRAGFLMLRLTKKDAKQKLFGVAYEPEKLRPYRECPADFDKFWADAIKTYDKEVPQPIKATETTGGKNKTCQIYELEIPATGDRTVWGYLTVPNDASKAPYPLIVTVPGAGPAGRISSGRSDAITLFVNVHYYKPLAGAGHHTKEKDARQRVEDEEYADKYPVKYRRYTQCGIAKSREDYFYYGSILAANRAIDWACSRPDVDLKRVYYRGSSQGGGFGLILTGLNKHIRRATVAVPAITDHFCFKIDSREAGWPRLISGQLDENQAAAEANAPYFDGVNFAMRIDVPIRFSVGFADTVCPPHAGYTAYNVCPSKDKDIFCGIGQEHSVKPEITKAMAEWLHAGIQ